MRIAGGAAASPGDLIVCTRNDHAIEAGDPGRTLANDDLLRVEATVRVFGRTGVEMEALTAAAVAGLTLIDMTKGVERGVYLESVRLLEKSGGRSGTWKR